MPERKNVKEHKTDAVQGEGSFIKLRRMTVGEQRDSRRRYEENGADATEISLAVLAEHVVGWNWVDDDGKALPIPSKDAAVMGRLTDEEINLISDLLFGSEEDIKN